MWCALRGPPLLGAIWDEEFLDSNTRSGSTSSMSSDGYWANLLRHINSALASRRGRLARNATFSVASNAQRTPTYASHCWLPRAWRFELRGAAPRRGLRKMGSQLGPVRS